MTRHLVKCGRLGILKRMTTLRLPDFHLPADLVAKLRALSQLSGTPALAYARISEDRTGAGAGEVRQLTEQCPLFERHGLRLAGVYLDNDISAASGKRRPDYEAMLTDFEAGLGSVLTAWHPDRMYRRLVDLERLIDLVNARRGQIHTARAGDVDLSTPTGRAMARTAAVWAGHEVEHGIERLVSQKAEAGIAGKWRGGPRSFGYEPGGMVLRESEADELRKAAYRVLSGEDTSPVVKDLNDRGIRTATGGEFSVTSLRRTLLNPRNAGVVIHDGTEYQATWPAIIKPSERRGLIIIYAAPTRRTTRYGRFSIGTSLYRCGVCDDGATVRVGGGAIYRCKGPVAHLSRQIASVDQYVIKTIGKILVKRSTKLRLVELTEVDTGVLEREATAIREALDELARERGRRQIDGREYQLMAEPMKTDLDSIRAQLSQADRRSPLSGIADADDVMAAWTATIPSRQRAVIADLATVTLLRQGRGLQSTGTFFSPDSVQIEPRD